MVVLLHSVESCIRTSVVQHISARMPERHTSEMQDPLLWQRSSDVKARDLVVTVV